MAASTRGFAGYICWNEQAVQEVIPVDAVASSDAVFLATHQQCKILKRPLGDTAGGTPVEEEDVLATFLAANTDMMLMPIIGQSGTGKSHLVRWMRARIPDTANRRVIYVPKYGTSLRAVIELILEQMEGNAAADLRKSLKESADQFSPEEAPAALLDALARTLEYRSRQGGFGASADDRKFVSASLPIMLRDGIFRDHLLRDGGVIKGFVSKAVGGTRPGDREEAFAFTVEDFPVNIPDLPRANRDAQDVHAALSSDPELRGLAASMLTEQLGPAVNDVFGLSGATSLTDIMRRTRKVLGESDQELVILIEDFTVLQGIQRELLDALIEPSVRDGVKVLCPIRVAMAVTSGYFASLEDTIRTRAGFVSDVFVLDVPYASEEGWSTEAVESFVGKYLNAARLGEGQIETDAKHSRGPSNACDSCPHKRICHDSFGVSAEGYGLYPFNSDALDRGVRATVQTYFDPRAVLGGVVRFMLDEQRQPIKTGAFPGPSFEAKYQQGSLELDKLSIPVREELSRLPNGGERYAALLTFWGACPPQVVDLAPGIHEAFSLPPLGKIRLPPKPPGEVKERGSSQPQGGGVEPELSPAVTANLEALETWVAGGELLQILTRDLRSFIAEAIWTRIEWSDLFFHAGGDGRDLARKIKAFDDYSIQIEGSPTRRETGKELSIVLSREPSVAALFRGIVLARHHKGWRFPDGDRLYRDFSNRLDMWAASLVEAVNARRFGNAEDGGYVKPRVEALALSARILGVSGADSDKPTDLLVAALAETQSSDIQPEKGWERICARAAKERSQLRKDVLTAVAGRQGTTGRARAIDPLLLLPIVAEYAKTWEMPQSDPDDTELRRYVKSLGESLRIDLDIESSQLVQMQGKLADYLPAGRSIDSVGELLIRAGDSAADASTFSPPAEYEAYQAECTEFRGLSLLPIEQLKDLLALDWDTQRGAVLAGLSNLNREQLNRLIDLCGGFQRRLQQTSKRAETQLAVQGAGGGLAAELDKVLASIHDLLSGSDDGP